MTASSIEITPGLLNFVPPNFSDKQVLSAVFKNFNLKGILKPLMGERDQNFHLTSIDGQQYIVKISGPNEDKEVVQFQTEGLLHIENHTPQIAIPRIFKTIDGAYAGVINNNTTHQIRILSYLPGVSVGNDIPYDNDILKDVGRYQGHICKALSGFSHPASKYFMAWNSANGLAFNPNLHAKFNMGEQAKIAELIAGLEERIFPAIKNLRHQVIHNDGHSWNILFKSKSDHEITGIIDFGDMVYAPMINDLAVTAESFARPSGNLITAIGAVAEGFNEIIPLKLAEIELLHDLVTLRGMVSLLLQGYKNQISSPPNQDLIDEQPGNWKFVERMNEIDRSNATEYYKTICKI